MKKCTYCGKEYPEDAVVCVIDEHPLESDQPAPVPEPVSEAVGEDSKVSVVQAQNPPPASTDEMREVPEGFVLLGDMDPLEVNDLLGQFQTEGIRFLIDEVVRTRLTGRGSRKVYLVEICVHQDDYTNEP